MERLRRVAGIWSWLPAFRAVGETEHLPTASTQLFVSASALSRTIRLLEEQVGQALFVRHGRRIELNEAGQRFLVAVRDAMRLVHEGLIGLAAIELEGPVYIASAGLVTDAFVMPGLRALRATHPGLVPHVSVHAAPEIPALLLQGKLDVAFVTHPIPHPQLTKLHLGSARNGIYCGSGHALFRKRKISEDELLEHPFVALSTDDRGAAGDGWPAAVDRRIAMVVSDQSLAVDVCASGDLLAVLPHPVATAPPHGDRLRRLPVDLVPSTDVFAQHRRTLAEGGRAETVVEAVAAVFGKRAAH